jgi:hypothetical protein
LAERFAGKAGSCFLTGVDGDADEVVLADDDAMLLLAVLAVVSRSNWSTARASSDSVNLESTIDDFRGNGGCDCNDFSVLG